MTTADAVAALNRFAHRNQTGWHYSGGTVDGAELCDTFSPFEARAIAAHYIAGQLEALAEAVHRERLTSVG